MKRAALPERTGYVVLAHCLLNVCAKVDGYGSYSGALKELVLPLIKEGWGIVQLPCPETTFAGRRRWGQTRDQYDTPAYRRHCRALLEPVLDQLEDDIKNGVTVLGVVGVEGSPTCGVTKTCIGYLGGVISDPEAISRSVRGCRAVPGPGVFIRTLQEEWSRRGLSPLPMTGVDSEKPSTCRWSSVKKRLLSACRTEDEREKD
ncbi:CD3072 family TudS-related putative desulfidase [Jonquetella sp. BV3C21]|uniref:CD3072 family TudS-related putative desulfidase n=1 Tax=Jonquetella sp. BV3C21 TaxID=1111126 RepID=UPI0003ADB6D2|nr:CD3072 family TudS-related putative desulfidase [Jonquetella sp. BV3C21]ERL23591.1 PF04463 family protein [Jonquetella sp. BV3C21]